MVVKCKYGDGMENGYANYNSLDSHVRNKHADDTEYVDEIRLLRNKEMSEKRTKNDNSVEGGNTSIEIPVPTPAPDPQLMEISETLHKLGNDLNDLSNRVTGIFNIINNPVKADSHEEINDPLKVFVNRTVSISFKGEQQPSVVYIEEITDTDIIFSTKIPQQPTHALITARPRSDYVIISMLVAVPPKP